MSRRYIYTFSLLIIVTLFSCSKEKSIEGPDANQSYLPQDTLHYEDTTLQTGFRLIATDSVKEIDGITFHAYKNIPDSLPEDTSYTYLGDSSGAYYVKSFLSQLGGQKTLILQQNAKKGENWMNTFSINGMSVNVIFQVKEKGISHSVFAHTFESVIHLKILTKDLTYIPGGGGNISVPIGDIYFAPDVGIIQLDINNPLDDQTSVHLLLTDF